MTLWGRPKKLGPVGLRPALIKVHKDLLMVDRLVRANNEYSPDILNNVEIMTLVLEDKRFFSHVGVDLISSVREIIKAIMFQRHGGASTIDMQFVRTATGYRQRSIFRKLYEVFLAIIIQYRYQKIVILRSYLFHAFLGSRLRGVRDAAMDVYGCDPELLSVEQSAFIAAMLVYPKPVAGGSSWKSRVLRRANYGVAVYRANEERFKKLPS